jgi:hypothetical protein
MSERDRDRFSLIGHAHMPFMCPLREEELIELLDHADLRPGDRTLDLGGGRADLACLLARRYRCSAASVDRSAPSTEAARSRARGLDVEVAHGDAARHLALQPPASLALASVVGAVHCFGAREPGWEATVAATSARARRVLVGDLAARSARAAEAFDVARLDALPGAPPDVRSVRASLVLGPERVLAYERAWCASVAAYVARTPDDPRNAWARQRIAWADEPSLASAREDLVFAIYLL